MHVLQSGACISLPLKTKIHVLRTHSQCMQVQDAENYGMFLLIAAIISRQRHTFASIIASKVMLLCVKQKVKIQILPEQFLCLKVL